MKYTPQDYVKAFLSLIEEHKKEESKIIEGLVRMIAVSGDLSRMDEILDGIEIGIAKREGDTRVSVRSARPLKEEILERIRKEFGANVLATNCVVPELLGGVQIIVNGEKMIDTTLKRKLSALFEGAI